MDISNIPRKTTNIIERFQQAYEGFGSEAKKDSMDVQKAYSSNVDRVEDEENGEQDDFEAPEAKTTSDGRRRSKKEVLKVLILWIYVYTCKYT